MIIKECSIMKTFMKRRDLMKGSNMNIEEEAVMIDKESINNSQECLSPMPTRSVFNQLMEGMDKNEINLQILQALDNVIFN